MNALFPIPMSGQIFFSLFVILTLFLCAVRWYYPNKRTGNFTKYQITQKYGVLKNRSNRSIEKIADAHLDLSQRLAGGVFVGIIALPLIGIARSIFSLNIQPLKLHEIIESGYFASGASVLIVGAILAINFREFALDVYDSLPDKN
ncbi:MAG: hypothetical protein MJK04_22810 [Psychrosphaera sp.]|nr:hypothetical protein [Psychrosphaera sp.]